MEKQIEEMAKDVCVNCMSDVCASGRCKFQYDCPLDMDTVKRLYLKGYRKASEVAREIFEEIECAFSPVLVYAGHNIKQYLAELKKKYESEGEKDNGNNNK